MKTRGMIRVGTALVVALSLTAVGCGGDEESTESGSSESTTSTTMMESGGDTTTGATGETGETGTTGEEAGTIPEVAEQAGDFTTLLGLVETAGLAETLSGPGPFTVFAPTDEAFAAVPKATLDQLAQDPKGALASVLKLHVISGEVDAEAATAAAGTCVDTLGGKVKVEESGGGLTIGGAKIVKTDIAASNGMIHVIDGVITAPSTDC